MRIAVVGLGFRSIKVLNYLLDAMPEANLVGYIDPNPILISQLNKSHEINSYETIEDLLDDCRPDLLFVGSPNHLHLQHIRAGLEAGIRVFSEKPVVSSLDQTWELAELLKKHGSDRLMVGLVLRYSQHMIDLTRAIDANQLGEIISMEANEHIGTYHGAFFMRDWRRYRRYSGGYMLEKCCHDLDLYTMIAGARPEKVTSFGGRRAFVPKNTPLANEPVEQYFEKPSLWNSAEDAFSSDGDIVDHQSALIQYSNGVTLAFHTNINSPEKQRRFCVFGSHGMAEGEFQKGYLKVQSSRTGKVLVDVDYQQMPDAHLHHYGADARMANRLTAFLRDETGQLPVSACDAMEAGIVAFAIDEAMQTGRIVDLNALWTKFDAFELMTGPQVRQATLNA